jgi:hypothetical protein
MSRPYLTRRLEADSKAIRQHQEQIKKSQKETNDMLKQIEQLQTAPKIFSNRKCAASGECVGGWAARGLVGGWVHEWINQLWVA